MFVNGSDDRAGGGRGNVFVNGLNEDRHPWPARDLLRDADISEPAAAPTASAARGVAADTDPSVSLITTLWWYRRLTIGVLAGATVIGGLSGVLLEAPPTAVAQIAVLDPRGNTVLRQGVTSETSFQTYTEQRAIFAQSTGVLALAAGKLSAQGIVRTVGDLRQQVRATVSDSGALINVAASADTSEAAVLVANAVVASYQDLTRKDLQTQVDAQDRAVATAIGSLSRTLPKGVPSSVSSNAAASTIAQLQARAANAAVDASAAMDGTRFVVAAQVQPAGGLHAALKGATTGAAAGLLGVIVLGYALADRVPAVRVRRDSRSGRRAAAGPGPAGPAPARVAAAAQAAARIPGRVEASATVGSGGDARPGDAPLGDARPGDATFGDSFLALVNGTPGRDLAAPSHPVRTEVAPAPAAPEPTFPPAVTTGPEAWACTEPR